METMYLALRCTVAAIFLSSLGACTSAENNAVPLSYEDSEQLDKPLLLWTPNLTKPIDERPVILGVILFDGTENDRTHVPEGERQTIEGHLYDELCSPKMPICFYYTGAGTEPGWLASLWDAAFGSSVKGIAEKAVVEVLSEITTLRQSQPDADVRLLVSGFSRGAATARQFMNKLEQRWDVQQHVGSPPRFYALIFDTVATGQRDNLQLGVPVSADIFYHFVSKDERRVLFNIVLDEPQSDADGRVVTIERPGVHSDIGASYSTGVGSEYVVGTDALLSRMGLIPRRNFEINGDVRSQGKNDSRWNVDRALGIGPPNSPTAPKDRNAIFVPILPMPDTYRQQWERRMFALSDTGGVFVSGNHKQMYNFVVKRFGPNFDVTSITPLLSLNQKIQHTTTGYVLTVSANGVTLADFPISSSILGSLAEGQSTHLDLGIIDNKDGSTDFWWFVDNVRREKIGGSFYHK